jgi:DNA polymerase-3 subunit gamma/tau
MVIKSGSKVINSAFLEISSFPPAGGRVFCGAVSYRVFARKYRPQTFEQVVGQEHITRTLQNAIRESRVAQAYMFVGPRGIGKTSTARILAKALNCQSGPTSEPCGTCSSCLEIAEGRSLDVMEIDGASNNGVENIRDLRENAAYAPARGPYKIYLIDEVHMLSTGAFNALLKTLEEPPEHVKFIFATTEAQKVPATITSRCQRFDLRRIPTEAIASHLASIADNENVVLEKAAADAIARAAEGGLRDAESMLDQAVAFCGDSITEEGVMSIFGFTSRQTVSGLVGHILEHDVRAALNLISEQADSGKDLSRLLGDATAHVRDLLVEGVSSDAPSRREQFLLLLDHFAEAEQKMRWAPDKKLQFDVAVIKAVHLLGQASLDDILASLTALRSGEALPASAPRPREISSPATAAPPRPVAPSQPVPLAAPPASPDSAPVASKPPISKPPAAKPATEEVVVDASVAWERVSSEYEKSLIYRWLSGGVFQGLNGLTLTIALPPSAREGMESLVGDRGRKEAEGKLAKALGKPVKLVLEIGDHVPELEISAEVEPAPPVEIKPAAATPTVAEAALPTDAMETIKDDPLIHQALEIFSAELQTKP